MCSTSPISHVSSSVNLSEDCLLKVQQARLLLVEGWTYRVGNITITITLLAPHSTARLSGVYKEIKTGGTPVSVQPASQELGG